MEEANCDITGMQLETAHAAGGSFITKKGRYDGNWYQCIAYNGSRAYILIWTNVDWSQEDESNRCDWNNPEYVFDMGVLT